MHILRENGKHECIEYHLIKAKCINLNVTNFTSSKPALQRQVFLPSGLQSTHFNWNLCFKVHIHKLLYYYWNHYRGHFTPKDVQWKYSQINSHLACLKFTARLRVHIPSCTCLFQKAHYYWFSTIINLHSEGGLVGLDKMRMHLSLVLTLSISNPSALIR